MPKVKAVFQNLLVTEKRELLLSGNKSESGSGCSSATMMNRQHMKHAEKANRAVCFQRGGCHLEATLLQFKDLATILKL
jgi:hypothetical protein